MATRKRDFHSSATHRPLARHIPKQNTTQRNLHPHLYSDGRAFQAKETDPYSSFPTNKYQRTKMEAEVGRRSVACTVDVVDIGACTPTLPSREHIPSLPRAHFSQRAILSTHRNACPSINSVTRSVWHEWQPEPTLALGLEPQLDAEPDSAPISPPQPGVDPIG